MRITSPKAEEHKKNNGVCTGLGESSSVTLGETSASCTWRWKDLGHVGSMFWDLVFLPVSSCTVCGNGCSCGPWAKAWALSEWRCWIVTVGVLRREEIWGILDLEARGRVRLFELSQWKTTGVWGETVWDRDLGWLGKVSETWRRTSRCRAWVTMGRWSLLFIRNWGWGKENIVLVKKKLWVEFELPVGKAADLCLDIWVLNSGDIAWAGLSSRCSCGRCQPLGGCGHDQPGEAMGVEAWTLWNSCTHL